MIRVGFVGAGRVFEHYQKMLKKISKKKYIITCVCDIDPKKKFKFNNKIFFYINLELMLKEQDLDLLIVLTPSGLHFDHVRKGLNANINVLVEKPITLHIQHAEVLIKLAKSKKLYLGVMFQNRFNKSIQFAKKMISKSKFKNIISTNIQLVWSRNNKYYSDQWHGSWLLDGGVLSQQLIHHIDALRFLFGGVQKVYSINSRVINKLEAEDSISCIMKYDKGFSGTVNGTTAFRPVDLEASLTIIATNGYLKIGGIALNKIIKCNLDGKEINNQIKLKNSEAVSTGYGKSHLFCLEHIFDNLKKQSFYRSKFLCPFDALDTLKIVSSLYRSYEDDIVIYIKKNKFSNKLGF